MYVCRCKTTLSGGSVGGAKTRVGGVVPYVERLARTGYVLYCGWTVAGLVPREYVHAE